MAGEDLTERKLDQTPTWAVAGVCAVIIIVSIALEKVLHKLGKLFTDKHKKALFNALEKVKAELMVLGFISLILTFSQYYIAKICIPVDVADTMLPCAKKDTDKKEVKGAHRLLLWYEHGRSLAGAPASTCKEGKVPIITVDGLHQLHILIFFLAVLHVAYSAVTMALGRLKTRGWKQWEEETSSHNYEFSNDPSRFRLTHETSFVRAHTSFWTRIPIFFYIGCFFRQFFRSVSKSDYMTLRNGFINLHLAPGTKFNFQKYIKRSLEDDFQVVVGVSPVLWASFVIFLLLNVNGWQAMFWASIIPLVIILAVGTKLQAILTKMALEITERHAVVQGIPLVQASDKYFWFSKPSLMLHLIHFALFQYEYKINSCFHDNMKLVILKLTIGVGTLILCSYITLPLYALLSQMGSTMKKSIFDEQTARALKNWRMVVKRKQGGKGGKTPTRSVASSLTASPVHSMASPIYRKTAASLHRFKTTGHSTHSVAYEDTDASDFEAEPLSPESSSTTHLIDPRVDDHSDHEIKLDLSTQQEVETRHEDEFSFAKSVTPLQ
ncbi:hypothetical protein M8C21_004661 [Ambrosia artemisiifolia]|uniref:MLO-like protein n=1 Tax=Ambrosia artemisiifolia TaxID=4212 RepID=A0AAD5D8Y2_AMBAR|nr:hypothetical protein M8C21_004661 [Ambrosia artemisiifolia]